MSSTKNCCKGEGEHHKNCKFYSSEDFINKIEREIESEYHILGSTGSSGDAEQDKKNIQNVKYLENFNKGIEKALEIIRKNKRHNHMKFNHGDYVTCEINGKKITDARISIGEDYFPYICQNVCNGLQTKELFGYEYSWFLKKNFTKESVTNLQLAEKQKSWEDLKVGDSVWDANGIECKITLARKIYEHSEANSTEYSPEEFRIYNYSLTPPPKKLTVTKQQIAEKFGVDISNLIIE